MAHKNVVFTDYSLLQDFFDSFSNSSSTSFDNSNPIIVELDEMMELNKPK